MIGIKGAFLMVYDKKQGGFSLIEVTIILMIAGLLLSSFFQVKKIVDNKKFNNEYYTSVILLSSALEQFARLNGFYPNPSSLTINSTDAQYGRPVDTTLLPDFSGGECTSTSLNVNGVFCRVGQRNLDGTGGIGNTEEETILIGALPTSILGINFDESSDMYAQRFTYAVSRNLTEEYADPNFPLSTSNTFEDDDGNIRILSHQTGGNLFDTNANVHYVIISHGRNQSGSYGYENGSVSNICNATFDTIERENCDLDSVFSATTNSTLPDPISGTPGAVNGSILRNVLDSGGLYYDDAISYSTSIKGGMWTARGFDSINMTSGSSTQDSLLLIGNATFPTGGHLNHDSGRSQVWVGGSTRANNVITKRVCDARHQKCFRLNDITSTEVASNEEDDTPFNLTDPNPQKILKCINKGMDSIEMIDIRGGRKSGRKGEANVQCIFDVKLDDLNEFGVRDTSSGDICPNGAREFALDGTLICL